MRSNKSFLVLVALLVLQVGHAALAAPADPTPLPDEEYELKLHAAQQVSPLTSELAGEEVSMYDGSTTFSVTDADIPGNNALPVRIGRRLKIIDRHMEGNLPGFGDWDLDLPRIEGTFLADRGWKLEGAAPYARCTSRADADVATTGAIVVPLEIWNGNTLYIPGKGEEPLLINDQGITNGQSYPWITSKFTRVGCLASTLNNEYPGEAFVAITADGTKYTFNHVVSYSASSIRVQKYPDEVVDQAGTFSSYSVGLYRYHVALLPTQVEDRFGNTVTYHYNGSHLSYITSSDNRWISLVWDGSLIQKVIAHGTVDREWDYGYDAVSGYAYPATLASVTQPDQSTWTYSAVGTLKPVRREAPVDGGQYSECPLETDIREDPGYQLTVGHPAGAKVVFDFAYARSRRAHTPSKSCRMPMGHSGPYPYASHYWDGYQLVSKSITGPGIDGPLVWNYSYGYVAPSFYTSGEATDPCSTCQQSKSSTVTAPDGSYTQYTFGDMYGLNDGQLLSVERGQGTDAPLSVTDTRYVSTADVAAQQFPDVVGTSPTVVYTLTNHLRPVVKTTITQGGVTFSSSVPATSGVYAFDSFGRTLQAVKSSSLGYSKTDATTYFDDRAAWVLGQVSTTSTDGTQTSRTTYDADSDLPISYYSFGKLQHKLTYNADGTLATITDGNQNTTTLSSWFRGIPRWIHYPATPESPNGATQSAVVNSDGWITSTSDPYGYTTSYGYDAAGRVTSITWPTGDSNDWAPTTIDYSQVEVGEFGIGGGHWKQTTDTGNLHHVVYFDGLWRPLLTYEYDTTKPASTRRYTRVAYDAAGHKSFVGYPTTAIPDVRDELSPGTRSSFDALGRVTQVDQDSELGVLSTVTHYLSGFRTWVQNPRLETTTTSYQAYDQPSTDLPVAIDLPEGAYTDITRDAFGAPLLVTRRNATGSVSETRNYYYDGYHQLCRTAEPETGSTVSSYDAANNLAWSASGLNYSLANACYTTPAHDSGRRVDRTYDARNRITGLSFPDGQSDTTYTYTADGKPRTVTALNGGSDPVTTTYTYNRRRLLYAERLQFGDVDWTLGYSYDDNGHLSGQTYPGNAANPGGLSVDYAPNALGQPTRAGSYATGVTYYPNGAMHQFTYGNGIVHTLTQNDRDLPDRSRDAYGTAAVLDDGYDYDENGNVLAISDGLPSHRGDRDMAYDGLDRLTSTTSPMLGASGATYTYDVLDNLRRVKAPGRDHTYVYDDSWRLTNVTNTVGGATVIGLGYDPQGNLQNKSGVTYAFDMGNRLRSVSADLSGGPQSTYIYDGNGRRVRDTTTGEKRSIYSAGGQLMYDDNQRTSVRSNYIYLNGSLVARDSNADALGTPVLTVPGSDDTGGFAVAWSTLALASRYQLQERLDGGTWSLIYDGNATSKDRTGKPEGTYDYRVRGCIDTVCGDWSGIASLQETLPPVIPAAAPALTVPSSGPNGSYDISWGDVSGAASYKLEESANGGAWTVASNDGQFDQAFSGRPAGAYAYRVSACNAAGCGPLATGGNSVQVVYPPTPAPTVAVAASSNDGSYNVTWTAVASASTYNLEESLNGGGWNPVYTGAAQLKTVTGAARGTHSYRVNACNDAGCSDVSAADAIVVTYPPAIAPTLTATATSSTGSYGVSWAAVSTATSYALYENISGSSTWTLIQNTAARSRSITGKDDGTYGYKVKGCNVGGCGPLSAVDSTVVDIPPPVAPTLVAPGVADAGSPYTVSWSAPATATSYQLQEAISGTWSLVYNGAATSASRTHAVGTYSYRVRACSAKGCGAYSATDTTSVERSGCSTCLMPDGTGASRTGTEDLSQPAVVGEGQ